MLQYDSLATWARSVFSSKPHLQAAHWMISSVVPVKLPVARGNCSATWPDHVVVLYGVLFGPDLGLAAAHGGGALGVGRQCAAEADPPEVAGRRRRRGSRGRGALLGRALGGEHRDRGQREVAAAELRAGS